MRPVVSAPPLLLMLFTAYACGAAIADYWSFSLNMAAALVGIMLVVCIIASRNGPSLSMTRLLTGIALFFALGLFLAGLNAERLESSLLNKAAQRSAHATVEGILTSEPTQKNNTTQFEMQVIKVRFDGVFDGAAFKGREWVVHERALVKVRGSLSPQEKRNVYFGAPARISARLALPKSSGDFDYRRFLYHKGIMALLRTAPEDIQGLEATGHRFSPVKFVGSVRHWIKERTRSRLPEMSAGLLNGIVLGDQSSIDKRVEESFRATGLSHVVAASGMNIALIVGALWPILRLLRLRAPTQIVFLLLFTAAYTVMSGMSASITRAFLMAAIALVAWLLGREKDALGSLSLAGLILLIIDPFTLYDVGFQLSFGATASLIVFSPIIDKMMLDIPKSIRTGLSVTVAAQIGVVPILVYYFGQLSAISLVANLFVTPLAAPALILGIAVLPIEALLSVLATPIYIILRVILSMMIAGATILGKSPGAYVVLPQISALMVLTLYAIIAALGLCLSRINLKLRLGHVTALIILVSVCAIGWQLAAARGPSQLEVTFLDVGQGDSALLSTPDGTRVLVDAGPTASRIASKLEERGVRKLDAVVLTHAHDDHFGGAMQVLEKFAVGMVVCPQSVIDAKVCRPLFRLAKQKGVSFRPIAAGDKLQLDECLKINVLSADASEECNDQSAVLLARYRELSLLLTGDAGEQVEVGLVRSGRAQDIDILKAGHHGSATSSSRIFLRKVKPEISIVSVGESNMYGHPSKSALHRIAVAGSKIYRTDEHGDVTIRSDGKTYHVYTEK